MKKEYQKPTLERYGTVADITQSTRTPGTGDLIYRLVEPITGS